MHTHARHFFCTFILLQGTSSVHSYSCKALLLCFNTHGRQFLHIVCAENPARSFSIHWYLCKALFLFSLTLMTLCRHIIINTVLMLDTSSIHSCTLCWLVQQYCTLYSVRTITPGANYSPAPYRAINNRRSHVLTNYLVMAFINEQDRPDLLR